jgi:uncharacterized protein (TIGR03437 family)
MTDLNLSSWTQLPMAVSDSGIVTGAQVIFDLGAIASATPFIVQQNGSLLQPPDSLDGVLPFGLNNAGQLVGSRIGVTAGLLSFFVNSQALLYPVSSGTATVLQAPPSAASSVAFGLSSNGTVAGASISQDGSAFSPVLWQDAEPRVLPILSGYQQSATTAVNDSGVAVGLAFEIDFAKISDSNAQAHAVRFNTDGSITDLGVSPGDVSSIATGINNSGWVVGFSSSQPPDFTLQLAAVLDEPTSIYHPFVYANGTMNSLNKVLINGNGWTLFFVTQINNAGQIVGTGVFRDSTAPEQQHAFLLTPVTANSSPVITAVVGAGLSVPAVSSISTNGLISIFGSNLAPEAATLTQTDVVNNQLPTTLGGTCVRSGTSNCGTANEVASTAVNVTVAAASPEFLYFVPSTDGQDPVAAVEAAGGAYVGNPGLIASTTFAPARAGDVLTAYGVGWGPTASSVSVGSIPSAPALLASAYSLTLGGMPVNVSYAGLAPGEAGLYQINFIVPVGLDAGNQPLVLTVNGIATPAQAYIAVSH